MTTSNDNVISILDFDNIDAGDVHNGMLAYSHVERQVDALKSSVATWLFGYVQFIWAEQEKMPTATLEVFTARLQKEIDYITSDAAGGNKLSPAQAKLTGRNSLAAAYKKIKNYLEKGLSLDDVTSVSACGEKVAQANKDEKKQEQDNKKAAEIAQWARNAAKEKGLDPDSDEGKAEVKCLTDEKLKQIDAAAGVTNEEAQAPETVEDNSYINILKDRDLAIPNYLTSHAEVLADHLESLKADAIQLLINKALIMNGSDEDDKADKALDQVLEGVAGQSKKWKDQATSHRKLAIENGFLVIDDEDEDLAEAG